MDIARRSWLEDASKSIKSTVRSGRFMDNRILSGLKVTIADDLASIRLLTSCIHVWSMRLARRRIMSVGFGDFMALEVLGCQCGEASVSYSTLSTGHSIISEHEKM